MVLGASYYISVAYAIFTELTYLWFFRINSLRKIRQDLGLERPRRQKHTLESIHDHVQELRALFPLAGAKEMVSLLFHEKDLPVERWVQVELLEFEYHQFIIIFFSLISPWQKSSN